MCLKVLFAFVLIASAVAAEAQLPDGSIMNRLSLITARNSYEGMYNTMSGKEKTAGTFLRFTKIAASEDRYFETGTEIPLFTLISFIRGIDKKPPLIMDDLDSYEESQVGTTEAGSTLAYAPVSILHYAANYGVYDNFMLGGHIGWEGATATVFDADNINTERRTVDLNYWAFAPILSYQTDKIRVEAKYKFLVGKKIESGHQWEFCADYYMTDGEYIGISAGFYAQVLKVELPGGRQPAISTAGVRVSLLYWSLFNLL